MLWLAFAFANPAGSRMYWREAPERVSRTQLHREQGRAPYGLGHMKSRALRRTIHLDSPEHGRTTLRVDCKVKNDIVALASPFLGVVQYEKVSCDHSSITIRSPEPLVRGTFEREPFITAPAAWGCAQHKLDRYRWSRRLGGRSKPMYRKVSPETSPESCAHGSRPIRVSVRVRFRVRVQG